MEARREAATQAHGLPSEDAAQRRECRADGVTGTSSRDADDAARPPCLWPLGPGVRLIGDMRPSPIFAGVATIAAAAPELPVSSEEAAVAPVAAPAPLTTGDDTGNMAPPDKPLPPLPAPPLALTLLHPVSALDLGAAAASPTPVPLAAAGVPDAVARPPPVASSPTLRLCAASVAEAPPAASFGVPLTVISVNAGNDAAPVAAPSAPTATAGDAAVRGLAAEGAAGDRMPHDAAGDDGATDGDAEPPTSRTSLSAAASARVRERVKTPYAVWCGALVRLPLPARPGEAGTAACVRRPNGLGDGTPPRPAPMCPVTTGGGGRPAAGPDDAEFSFPCPPLAFAMAVSPLPRSAWATGIRSGLTASGLALVIAPGAVIARTGLGWTAAMAPTPDAPRAFRDCRCRCRRLLRAVVRSTAPSVNLSLRAHRASRATHRAPHGKRSQQKDAISRARARGTPSPVLRTPERSRV